MHQTLKIILDRKIWKIDWGCAVPSSAQLELAVYRLAHSADTDYYTQCAELENKLLSVWVGGAAGELKNKAKLSLNRV